MPAIILLAACKVNSKSKYTRAFARKPVWRAVARCAVETCAFFGVLAVRIGLLRRK